MKKQLFFLSTLLVVTLPSIGLQSVKQTSSNVALEEFVKQPAEVSQWLSFEKGSKGDILNAEVLDIRMVNGIHTIDIQLPESVINEYDQLLLFGKSMNAPFVLAQKPKVLFEEGKPYGIRFHLKNCQKLNLGSIFMKNRKNNLCQGRDA